MITQERLKELLYYHPESGDFVWRASRSNIKGGTQAGALEPSIGYIRIKVDGVFYLAHRLARLYVHGEMPEHEIDHKERERTDNRIDGLRKATKSQNQHNATVRVDSLTQAKGVGVHRGKYRARIKLRNARFNLGTFDTIDEAKAAYAAAAMKLHGEFARLS